MSTSLKRTRNFACMVYEESAPCNWISILSDQFIPCFISPYHDRDLLPTGELKKPHWHVILMFDSVKTEEQAREVFSLIGGVGCEVVKSIRGYSRYLCHLDNPDKALYNVEDVISLCGADYLSIIGLAVDRYVAIREMIDYVSSSDIYYYSDLVEYSIIHRPDWFRILCDSGSYILKEYIKSRTFKDRNMWECKD